MSWVAVAVSAYSAYRSDRERQRADKKADESYAAQQAIGRKRLGFEMDVYKDQTDYLRQQDAKREAEALRQRREQRGHIGGMMADAYLSNDDRSEAHGDLAANLAHTQAATRQGMRKGMSRHGVNPNSGQAQGAEYQLASGGAQTEAAGRQGTALGLDTQEAGQVNAARGVSLNAPTPYLNVLKTPMALQGYQNRGIGLAMEDQMRAEQDARLRAYLQRLQQGQAAGDLIGALGYGVGREYGR